MNILSKWFSGGTRNGRGSNGTRRVAELQPNVDPTNLDYRLLMLSPTDPYTCRMAVEGVCITGALGSGKSTGSGANLARSYLDADMGGLVLCIKWDEKETWLSYCRETGRTEAVMVISPSGKWRCNLLNYLLTRPGVTGSRTELIVNFLWTLNEIGERGEKGGGGKHDKFFERATKQLLRNAVEICVLARGKLSMQLLHQLITSAPRSHADVQDTAWQANSLCYRLIEEADKRDKSAAQRNDFEMAARYFLSEFVDYPPETRGSVLATWGALADPLLRGQMAELFDGETNFVPDVSFNGAVIILDLPTQIYGQAGAVIQAGFKYVWQLAAAQRDIKTNPRFAFFFCDEFPEVVSVATDPQFLALSARANRICTVVIGQTTSGYIAAMGGESGKHNADNLFAALNLKVFHTNSGETNKWASSLFAKDWQVRTNYSANRGDQHSASGGGSDMLESTVLESEFTRLKKGGPENNFCTEAILFQGGRVWKATGTTALRTIFRQKGGNNA